MSFDVMLFSFLVTLGLIMALHYSLRLRRLGVALLWLPPAGVGAFGLGVLHMPIPLIVAVVAGVVGHFTMGWAVTRGAGR